MKNKASVMLKQILSVLMSSMGKAKSKQAAIMSTKTNSIKTRFLIFSLMNKIKYKRYNKNLLLSSISHKFHAFLSATLTYHHHNYHHHEEPLQHQDIIVTVGKTSNGSTTTNDHEAVAAATAREYHKHEEDEEAELVRMASTNTSTTIAFNKNDYSLRNCFSISINNNCNDVVENDDEKYPDLTHTLFDSDCDEDFDDQTGSVIDLVRHSKEGRNEDFRLEDEIDHVAELFIRRFHRQIKMQKQESFNRYQEMLERSV